MPTGLKQSSSIVPIGFSVTEAAPNAFAQGSVDLNLSPLDREVFVVLAVNLDPSAPDNVATLNTSTTAALTTTSQTTMPDLSNANCLAQTKLSIRQSAAGVDGAAFARDSIETPSSLLEYVGIVATNDFFIQVQGNNNTSVKSMAGKLYGYRARASADIYAALVQSEVLSS
jgi:hypothetical protein